MRLIFLLCTAVCLAQHGHLHTVAFYNVENLFDAQDHPRTHDDDYTPTGRKAWQPQHVVAKIDQLAKVIAQIGQVHTQQPPLVLGLAEVENQDLLERLIAHPLLAPYGYQMAHVDSPDYRGIDVGLLYRKNLFQWHHTKAHSVALKDPKTGRNRTTRDILLVVGYLGEQRVHLLVNHWPSRRGGRQSSAAHRLAAAKVNRRITDSLLRKDPSAYIISMGDYNDNPTDKSMRYIAQGGLTNQSKALYKQGNGSLAYRDQWFLFDQMLFSAAWQSPTPLFFYAMNIHAPLALRTPLGKYKGYPWRTHVDGKQLQGYSDHFPVYALIGQRLDD